MPSLSDRQVTNLQTLHQDAVRHVSSLPQDTDDLDAFVVGGAVRDALLDEQSNDYDFVVVGETPASMRDRGFHEIDASSFPVFHDDDREEWALARTETKVDDGYKGFHVTTEDVSLHDDLHRRDLTMNAIAVRVSGTHALDLAGDRVLVDLGDASLYVADPFDGIEDINDGVIRHVSEAFSEDPVRVLRAARYASRYPTNHDDTEFTIDDATMDLMRRVSPELNRMSRDRVGLEIEKAMMQAADPTRFWTVLRDAGTLAVIAPKLDRQNIIAAGPPEYHAEGDAFTHTMLVLERMHNICERQNITGVDRVRRLLMAVSHDLGKVTAADLAGGIWSDDPPTRFSDHASLGAEDAQRLGERLGLDQHYIEVMVDAAEHHMNVFDFVEWDAERVIDFVDDRDPASSAKKPTFATTDELLDLTQSDFEGRFQDITVVEDKYEVESIPNDVPVVDGEFDGVLVRPLLDRDTYDRVAADARHAINSVDGYTVLRDGLCDTHADAGINDDRLAQTLAQCNDCRSPDSWVGDEITARRREVIVND